MPSLFSLLKKSLWARVWSFLQLRSKFDLLLLHAGVTCKLSQRLEEKTNLFLTAQGSLPLLGRPLPQVRLSGVL